MPSKIKKFVLRILPERLAICHFGKNASLPEWAIHNNDFFSITKTPDELSVVCDESRMPKNVMAERGWRAFRLEGPENIYSVGVIAKISTPLAKAKISIFDISTYETDYILVEEKNLAKAKKSLSKICKIRV